MTAITAVSDFHAETVRLALDDILAEVPASRLKPLRTLRRELEVDAESRLYSAAAQAFAARMRRAERWTTRAG